MARKKKTRCYFCQNNIERIDYKDVETLKKFITPRGKILPARSTGTCSRHQRQLTTAIKRARMMAMLPFVSREY